VNPPAKKKRPPVPPFTIGGRAVASDSVERIELPVAMLPTRTPLYLPVTVVHGRRPGPALWLSAALHGDELNGTEIIRRVLARVQPRRLRGTLVCVPVVNVYGFLLQSRYLPDRRDLNRSFPGSARGSIAGRLAHLFMTEIVGRCTHGIDLPTGSNHRVNLPQMRVNLDDEETRRLALAFGAPLAVHASTIRGSLRAAAGRLGLPILVYEAGEPQRFNRHAIPVGERGVLNVMKELGMLPTSRRARTHPTIEVRRTHWMRATRSGLVQIDRTLRDRVDKGDVVAVVRDSFGEEITRVKSRVRGIVIGHTLNPLAHRGEAIIHVAEI